MLLQNGFTMAFLIFLDFFVCFVKWFFKVWYVMWSIKIQYTLCKRTMKCRTNQDIKQIETQKTKIRVNRWLLGICFARAIF